MSKWFEELQKSNEVRIQKRIEKLKAEYNEFKANYRDFPYDRYYKAMEAREKEIDKIGGAHS